MDEKEVVISVENITVRLGERFFLNDTSWRIRKGENWAVLGPNGAGKTTLVKALTGRAPVVRGRIRYFWGDESGSCPSASARWIGYVSPEQHAVIHENENREKWIRDFSGRPDDITPVADFLSGPPASRAHHGKTDRADIMSWARRLDLTGLLGRDIAALSTGEMRRVLIARALLKRPRLLILDEPFVSLDPCARTGIRSILKRMITSGLQVILITHRDDDILPGISHMLYLENGRVVRRRIRRRLSRAAGMPGRGQKSAGRPESVKPPGPATGGGRSGGGTMPGSRRHGQVLIRMRNVRVAYGKVEIFRHFNWTVRQGEHWMITGPGGAGKSTLIRLIYADHPQVYANDITVLDCKRGSGETIWEIRRQMGFVSPELQDAYPGHTDTFAVVCSGFFDSLGLHRKCSGKQKDLAAKWVERLGIARLMGIPFERLSNGEARMVLIARSLVKSPKLLLLDEPCGGLDTVNRRRLLGLVAEIGNMTRTCVIYVTHHETEYPACITHHLRLP